MQIALREGDFDAGLGECPVDRDVQVAADLALCKLGQSERHLPKLSELIDDPNLVVGMYAMNAIEQTGIRNDDVKVTAEKAANSPYEFTQRFGKYLMKVN